MDKRTYNLTIPENATRTEVEAVHIMESLFARANACQTREAMETYLGSELAKPADIRRRDAIRIIRKAKREIQYCC
jgi:hypothetical protein